MRACFESLLYSLFFSSHPLRLFSTWLNVWTLNGDLLVSKKTSNNMGELITACVMTRGAEWIDAHNVIITGHANGAIKVCVGSAWCVICAVWRVCCVRYDSWQLGGSTRTMALLPATLTVP